MKTFVCFIALSSLLSLSLWAKGPQGNTPMGFEAYDTNKDGMIVEEEFSEAKAKRMQERADAGKPMRNAGNSPDFTFFDTNKDGKITPDELQKGQSLQQKTVKKGQ